MKQGIMVDFVMNYPTSAFEVQPILCLGGNDNKITANAPEMATCSSFVQSHFGSHLDFRHLLNITVCLSIYTPENILLYFRMNA